MASVTTSFSFIGNSYSTAAALPLLRSRANRGSNSRYQMRNISAGGYNDSAVATDFNVGNGISWTSVGAITAGRSSYEANEMNVLYYMEQGFDTEATGFIADSQKTTLSSSSAFTSMFTEGCAFHQGIYSPFYGVMYGIGVYTATGPAYANTARKLNHAETASSITTPAGVRAQAGAAYFNNLLFIASGTNDGADSGGQTSNLSWNESAWTANTVIPTAVSGAGCAKYNNAGFIVIGGADTGGTKTTATQFFNGTSWSGLASLATATRNFNGVAS